MNLKASLSTLETDIAPVDVSDCWWSTTVPSLHGGGRITSMFTQFSSLIWLIWSTAVHEGWFSRDPLPVFSRGGVGVGVALVSSSGMATQNHAGTHIGLRTRIELSRKKKNCCISFLVSFFFSFFLIFRFFDGGFTKYCSAAKSHVNRFYYLSRGG